MGVCYYIGKNLISYKIISIRERERERERDVIFLDTVIMIDRVNLWEQIVL